jgi:hypothetical protein
VQDRVVVVIAFCASLVVSSEATACDCSVPSVEGEFRPSQLVFEGVVARGNEKHQTSAEFEVLKVGKGQYRESIAWFSKNAAVQDGDTAAAPR